MADDMLPDCYELIIKLTKEAGKLMTEGFFGAKRVTSKGGRTWDLVTEYDTKVEDLLVSEIKKRYPDHLFIGEEESAARHVDHVLTDRPTWIIDPIDGTSNFIHGVPISCISVALAVGREVVLGVVYNPMQEQLYTARRGQGAFLNGQPITTSGVTDLDDAVVTTEPSLARIPAIRDMSLARLAEIITSVQGVRAFGCAAMTLCYIATGLVDAFVTDGLQCWDVAAGVLILREAGGHVCSTDGGEFDLMARTIVSASSQPLAQALVGVVRVADEKLKARKAIL